MFLILYRSWFTEVMNLEAKVESRMNKLVQLNLICAFYIQDLPLLLSISYPIIVYLIVFSSCYDDRRDVSVFPLSVRKSSINVIDEQ